MLKTSWPSHHLLGWAPYTNAVSHSDVTEFRARMKRRQEDAQNRERERIERERREADERQHEEQA